MYGHLKQYGYILFLVTTILMSACAKKGTPSYGDNASNDSLDADIEITQQPQDTSVHVGNELRLSVFVNASSTPSYQWTRNGVTLAGQTSRELVIASAATSDSGQYQVRVSITSGEQVLSRVATATVSTNSSVTPVVSISSQPQSVVTSAGSDVTLSVTASSSVPTVSLTYQWKKNGTTITGATSRTLRLDNITSADIGSYTVVVDAGSAVAKTSNAAVVSFTGGSRPVVSQQPGPEIDQPHKQYQRLRVVVSSSQSLTYRWYANGRALSDNSRITGTNSNTLEFRSVESNDYNVEYKLKITGAFGSMTLGPYVFVPLFTSFRLEDPSDCYRGRKCLNDQKTADALCRSKLRDRNAVAISKEYFRDMDKNFYKYKGDVQMVYNTTLNRYEAVGGEWEGDNRCNHCQEDGFLTHVTCQE